MLLYLKLKASDFYRRCLLYILYFILGNLSSKMQMGAKLCASSAITLSTGNNIPMIGSDLWN